ncbi:homeobox-leucine zipper protein [Dionaea muscipula]
MELALSLGDTSKPFSFMDKKQSSSSSRSRSRSRETNGFSMSLALDGRRAQSNSRGERRRDGTEEEEEEEGREKRASSDPPAPPPPPQLDLLLTFSRVPRPLPPPPPLHQSSLPCLPRLSENCFTVSSEPGSSDGLSRGFDVNRFPSTGAAAATDEAAGEESSPNSAGSSFMEFSLYRDCDSVGACGAGGGGEAEKATSRASDDDENGSTRKKLRLSKQQSVFLEDSFKEHHTLNPKLKLALAKQLNLRPRQVEVWFQNRRARTKLKQTEVDCEFLKRCCEALTDENRRLQKELQDLRALKTSQAFYIQHPATTLTMCPSCERVATASTAACTTTAASSSSPALAATVVAANLTTPVQSTTTPAAASTAALALSLANPVLPFSNAHQPSSS